MTPVAIQAEGADSYRVRFSVAGGEQEYVFMVDSEKIPVVKWDDKFRQDMGGLLDSATPLFEAILAFHKARWMMHI
jgi:hypothetical protein